MTIEQLISPKVTEWIDDYNKRLNEGLDYSDDMMFEEFGRWFDGNINAINESVKLNEGKFSDLFDDDDDKSEDDDHGMPEPEVKPVMKPADETEDESDDDELKSSLSKKVKVDNSSNVRRNVFKVVNSLYEMMLENGTNMNKVTYFKFLDTRDVKDMTALLAFTNIPNADLSTWDTSNVIHMEGMFYKSTFNNDSICEWNVGKCGDFKNMFLGSKFSYSLNKWKPKMITVRKPVYDKVTGEKTGYEDVEKRAKLPFVGAYEDEEREGEMAHWKGVFKDVALESKSSGFSHVMDFDTFMMNEGLIDKTMNMLNRGVKKVKDVIKSLAVRVNKFFVTILDEKGCEIPAMNPYTTLNYISTGGVPGVSGFTPVRNELVNDTVPEVAEMKTSQEYYGNIEKGSNEYENFKTFVSMLNESENKGVFTKLLNEERVGFSAVSGGLKNIRDIDSTKLKREIRRQMLSNPHTMGKDALKPLFIWGAPGIGKSTIPQAVIDEYNETQASAETKKSLLVIQCGDLTPDGLSLPMPVRTSLKDMARQRPSIRKYMDSIGMSDADAEDIVVTQSDDAPKTWLPCYAESSDKHETRIRNMAANGNLVEFYDADGEKDVEEYCDGGILMFDEFFRANPSIFKILMQIVLNRSYGNGKFKLGDRWSIIACSNRPNDDEEVSLGFEKSGAVVTTRFREQYNFIPDFKDWKKWAEKYGHFDEVTLQFITSEKDANDEYIYWHDIDPEKHSEGEVAHPTPRSWATLMTTLYNVLKFDGYSSIAEIPEDELLDHAIGTLGRDVGMKYVDWIKNNSDKILDVKSILMNSLYEIPSPVASAAEVSTKMYRYIETNYSADELPDVEYLLNMFSLFNRTYSKAKDNYIKEMHINILKLLVKSKSQAKALKKYFEACRKRYDITDEDLD